MVERFGCQVPEINYGNLGHFEKLIFNDQESTVRSCHWLDILGQKLAPPYAVTFKLARGESNGHPIQGNTSFVVNYGPHFGLTEVEFIKGVLTLGGRLAYPNYLVNGCVVSYKWYTALRPDEHGQVTESSDTINNEFMAPDGQMFCTAVPVQVAHAYIDFISRFSLKFYSFDLVAEINRERMITIR